MRNTSFSGWIKRHRAELDALILACVPNLRHLDDNARRQWVLNDEGLYLWARREGVRL